MMANLSAPIHSSCYILAISFSIRFATIIERMKRIANQLETLNLPKTTSHNVSYVTQVVAVAVCWLVCSRQVNKVIAFISDQFSRAEMSLSILGLLVAQQQQQ